VALPTLSATLYVAALNCSTPAGAAIVNVSELEVPPPGAGFTTVTGTMPAFAISAVPIDAVTCVLPTKVVVRATPFHCTTAPDTKPLPLPVNVNAAPPAPALPGTSDVNVGIGFASSFVIVNVAVLGLPSAAPPVGMLNVRLTVSSASATESFTMGMLTVLLVSPSANVTVVLTGV